MKRITTRFIQISALVAISFFTVGAVFSMPAIAQEDGGDEEEVTLFDSEEEDTAGPFDATLPDDVDPSTAQTISDLAIPTDQLELLVKPLTLEELEVEAAAWLLLLKNKVGEISTAEIAIKVKNQLIEAEITAAAAVEEAQGNLQSAEEKLQAAEPGTPDYERANDELEKAKQSLQDAQLAVEAAATAAAAIEEDATLQAVVQDAAINEKVDAARERLKLAKRERDQLVAGSSVHSTLTEKIDAVDQSLVELDLAEEQLKAAIPGSADYQSLSEAVSAAQLIVIDAAAQLEADLDVDEVPSGDNADETSEEALSDAIDSLGGAESDASDAGNQIDRLSTGTSVAQLTDVTENLEAAAEKQAELKNQLVVQATELQSERTAIIDRFNVVLDEIDTKGGDTASYRKYIDAVSGVEIDLTDTEGLSVRLLSWLQAEEGGIRIGIGLAQFVSILVASVIVSQILAKVTRRVLSHFGNTSSLFLDFAVMVVQRGTLVLGALLALSSLGVSLGPLLALVGGASFVLAFALQSNLGNFASGLMLLVNKPFDVGDEVQVAGYWAYVESISLANTIVRDFDGNIVTLPNNTVWESEIINYTHTDVRQVSLNIEVEFDQDIGQIKTIWMDIVAAHAGVLKDPGPSIFPWSSTYNYCIGISLKAWSRTEGYWAVHADLLSTLQTRFAEAGIELAIPPG